MLRKFKKKFRQLPLVEKQILEVKKLELFFQAADEALEDRLLFFLQDGAAEGGFIINWRILKEAINFIAKQQKIKAKSYEMKMEIAPIIKVFPIIQPTFISSSSLNSKGVNEETFEELVYDVKKLKVEMTALKKAVKPNVPQSSAG